MRKRLIQNGKIVTADGQFDGDVLVEGEQIVAIGRNLDARGADVADVINAAGLYVLPGGVDVHTHLSMEWRGHHSADDFFTGQRAAAFGGTTTHIDFALQEKGQSLRHGVDKWHGKANGNAVIDYSFHLAICDLNEGTTAEIAQLPAWGIKSIKLFMAYKDSLGIDDGVMLRVMQEAKKHGILTLVHAENGDAIEVLIDQCIANGQTEPYYHAVSRPSIMEAEATARAITLAKAAGDAPLFIVHCSCDGALDAVTAARQRGQDVTAETCIHYLAFTAEDLKGNADDPFAGAKYVCSPPLRTEADQEALWHGIKTGNIHSVSTDHCPWLYETQKKVGLNSFIDIPNGMPVIENRLHALWELGVKSGRLTPSDFVRLTSTAPAQKFGLYPRKGVIGVGSDADIVLWDVSAAHTVSAETHHSAMDYNAFEGWAMTGKPVKVFRRGELIVDGDEWLAEKGSGRFVER